MVIQSPIISLTTARSGQTGASAWVHIKYSNDGVTFTPHDGEDIGTYMGVYTDHTQEDSMTFSDYEWNKVVGDNAYTVLLTNENFSFSVGEDRKPLTAQSASTSFIILNGTDEVFD